MSDQQQERFDEAFRAWAARPPATPSGVAARRMEDRIRRRRPLTGSRWLVAAAAVAALAVGSVALLQLGSTPESPVGAPVASRAISLETDEVLIWLDPETPLYMTFRQDNGGS